ncbi:6823_t:CDS:1, partial [Paraglomus brasilianum]
MVFLEEHEGIYISPTIEHDSMNPTLLQCYAWVIAQAHINHRSPDLHDNGENSDDDNDKGSSDSAGSARRSSGPHKRKDNSNA